MIIIVGVSGALGSYLAESLLCDNSIIGTYNKHKPKPISGEIEFFKVDVCDLESIEKFVVSIAGKLQRVALINLAGISIDGMGHKMTENTWDRVIDTNLKGSFLMSRAMLPFMREQKWGRIINISSVVGQMGVPGTLAYSASKAGLFGLTRTLAAENARHGITVNALSLGYFQVGMINLIAKDVQEQIKGKIPMRHFGHPRNIELAIRFLIECDYVTGSVININGGLYS